MIEKHLSVADSVVERKITYRVACHHWPERLIMKNKNESRKINVLINRTEAILYGNQYIERLNMVDLNGVFAKTTDGTNKYVQTPVVAEKTVSTLVASLKSNRGQRVLSRFTEIVEIVPPATIIHHQPCDIEIENNQMETDVEIENIPETQPFSPEPRFTIVSNTLLLTPSVHPEIRQPITATPTSKKRTNQPDSPDAYPSVVKIHEYIKGKVMMHGIEDELLTTKFFDYIGLLQRMHKDFKPIVCQFGSNLKNAYVFPCPNHQIPNDTCHRMTIRLTFPTKSYQNEPLYCQTCSKLAKKVSVDVPIRRRTAPDSRVPSTHLTEYEKVEKINRLQQERQNLMKRINKGKVSSAKKLMQKEDLTFNDLDDNWQRPLDDAMTWFRQQPTKSQDALKKDLVKSILEATCDFKNSKEKWNEQESEEFAQFMIDEIQNKARAMCGKKTTVRFSQGTLRTSLTPRTNNLPRPPLEEN